MIDARQLAQNERVKPIGLPARNTEPIPSGRDPVWTQRQDPQTRVQQPLDQQPVAPLDRDQPHLVAHERAAQRPQPRLVMHERGGQDLLARLIRNQHVVLLGRPVDARIETSHQNFNSIPRSRSSQRPDQEVPLRMPIDRPSKWGHVLLPLMAPHRPPRGAGPLMALHGAGKARPSPGGGRGNNQLRMTHRQSTSRTGGRHDFPGGDTRHLARTVSPDCRLPAACLLKTALADSSLSRAARGRTRVVGRSRVVADRRQKCRIVFRSSSVLALRPLLSWASPLSVRRPHSVVVGERLGLEPTAFLAAHENMG